MVALQTPDVRTPLVPLSYLAGAVCPLPDRAEAGRGLRTPPAGLSAGRSPDRPRLSPAAEKTLACLSPAEQRVTELVVQGLSNKEIAAALNRAEPTIKHQLASTLRKFGVQSRCQLIVRLLT